MKLVFLSDHDSVGGAAQAASQIADAVLREAQAEPAQVTIDRVDWIAFFPQTRRRAAGLTHALWYEESAVKRQALRLPRKILPKTFPRPNSPEFAARRLRRKLAELRPEIISVHNLHAASPWGWGSHLIDVCLEFAPVAWTLHDMWGFTGRCAYSYGCEQFLHGCDASCPTAHELPRLPPERIAPAWRERERIFGQPRKQLAVVSPSHWLATQAKRGLLRSQRVETIPNPFPLPLLNDVPVAREDARRSLGIRTSGPVLLIAATDLMERRKGGELLPNLWQHIRQRPLTLLTMGLGTIAVDDPGIQVCPLGWIEDNARKNQAYAAADALLHPAPVDNLPNVVVEALRQGTPVIALPTGGLPEMIHADITGWLASAITPAALGQAVDRALEDLSQGKDLRQSCRAWAFKEYHLAPGRRYFKLFQELLNC